MEGSDSGAPVDVFTYCPLPYNGRGPAQSCVSLLNNPADGPTTAHLIIPRATKKISRSINVKQTMPAALRYFPWHYVSRIGYHSINKRYKSILAKSKNPRGIAYFWPEPPLDLVEYARSLGLLTVREMINCYRGTAKRILDDACERQSLPPMHKISAESVSLEREELALYDFIFASNKCAEASLIEAGVNKERILASSFGWSPERYQFDFEKRNDDADLIVLFVGTVSFRKGVLYLLKAWDQCRIKGKLILAGGMDPNMKPLIESYLGRADISFVDHVDDLSALYSSAHIFVFPTLEEGGPQVVYEAAGAGLPVITSPMGQGRIIEHSENGIVVDPDDVDGLADAILTLSENPELRNSMGRRGAAVAAKYDYRVIASERAMLLSQLVDKSRQDDPDRTLTVRSRRSA